MSKECGHAGRIAAAIVAAALLIIAGCGRSATTAPGVPSAVQGEGESRHSGAVPATPIGSEACKACHAGHDSTFRLTAHSRSMASVDVDAEPPDAQFVHELSGRSYSVSRQGGEFRHREWLGREADGSLVEADYPVRYCVGSGRHSRTYLAEIDGFLVESPITWYESKKAWGVSPGYDVPNPSSFERATDLGCLVCHVSQAEAIDGSYHRLRIAEMGIGCERCHGPGSLHAERHREGAPALTGSDPIVHPAKLPRDRKEAICAQCHLRGDATVYVPGKAPTSFQPGDSLAEVRIDFRAVGTGEAMTVVGHMEQMWASPCHKRSESLTCTSCHDVHTDAPNRDEAVREASRTRCIECHERSGCGLAIDAAERVAKKDDCIDCHMPQTDTDIPHIAFTHHRIHIPGRLAEAKPGDMLLDLVPLADVGGLSATERDRALGLALIEYAGKQSDDAVRKRLHERAFTLLSAIARRGEADGEAAGALACLVWEQSPSQSLELTQKALQSGGLSPGMRANLTLVLADTLEGLKRTPDALEWGDRLTRMRRHSGDWMLVADCSKADSRREIAALEKVVAIQPFRPDFQAFLRDAYRSAGMTEKAQAADRRVKTLEAAAKGRGSGR